MRESKEKKHERVGKILDRLDKKYGKDARCYLEYRTVWQLLFATILSAQCTDARVNMVTKDLFKKYKTLAAVASADLHEFENDIKSTGFYHNKAKNIIACANALMDRYGGKVPSDIESLTSLPGVGRKTANVIRGHIFGEPSIIVDTHVNRISNKLGLVDSDDPVKIEYALMEILPVDHWTVWNTNIIRLGREICIARRPKCVQCFLKDLCPSAVYDA